MAEFCMASLSIKQTPDGPQVLIGARHLSEVEFAALATAAGDVLSALCRASESPNARTTGTDRSPA